MGTQKTAAEKIEWLNDEIVRNSGKTVKKEVIAAKLMIAKACNRKYALDLLNAFVLARRMGIKDAGDSIIIPDE